MFVSIVEISREIVNIAATVTINTKHWTVSSSYSWWCVVVTSRPLQIRQMSFYVVALLFPQSVHRNRSACPPVRRERIMRFWLNLAQESFSTQCRVISIPVQIGQFLTTTLHLNIKKLSFRGYLGEQCSWNVKEHLHMCIFLTHLRVDITTVTVSLPPKTPAAPTLLYRGTRIFHKSRSCLKILGGDIKHVPYWGSTAFRRQRTNFGRPCFSSLWSVIPGPWPLRFLFPFRG